MLWLQALPLFALWVAYVFVIRGWVQAGRARYAMRPRVWRLWAMAGAALGSIAVLVGGLLLMFSQGWLTEERGLSALGALTAAVAGLAYVHLQSLAVALTLSLAADNVTRSHAAPSDSREDSSQGES